MSKHEWKIGIGFVSVFLLFYFAPVEHPRVQAAMGESLALTQDYAREHVILCLLPAFWIAGAIAAFVSQASVIRYLGPKAPKPLAYGVGSVSGSVLAVCSCTVLPLFAGIYRMGAGLGPAMAFLYSGPAINALAIILTANVLGAKIGLARALGAVGFSLIIGLIMAALFRKEEAAKAKAAAELPSTPPDRPLWQTATFFGVMVAILIFANWGGKGTDGFFGAVYDIKWVITGAAALTLAGLLVRWFHLAALKVGAVVAAVALASAFPPHSPLAAFSVGVAGLIWLTAGRDDEAGEWFTQSWTYAKLILPLLFAGVLVAGLLLGRPGHEALIPPEWIASMVGENTLGANLFASVAGAFMYFATLTEVPILQGLMGNGMAEGPALALLLAGPALSLPNMIVIHTILGGKKTLTFIGLVVLLSTLAGWMYGAFL